MKRRAYARKAMLREKNNQMYKTMYRMLKERPVRIYLETVRRQGRLYAPLESIPPEVREIFVTREDPGFYRHKGEQRSG